MPYPDDSALLKFLSECKVKDPPRALAQLDGLTLEEILDLQIHELKYIYDCSYCELDDETSGEKDILLTKIIGGRRNYNKSKTGKTPHHLSLFSFHFLDMSCDTPPKKTNVKQSAYI